MKYKVNKIIQSLRSLGARYNFYFQATGSFLILGLLSYLHFVQPPSIDVGFTYFDKLLHFLMFFFTMCSIGGGFGVLLGFGIGYGVSRLASRFVTIVDQWPFVFAVEWIGISLVFSAIIGISFGLYPAFRAANLQPVEALRTE